MARPKQWLYAWWIRTCTLDVRSLSVFRIGLALLILVDLSIRSPDLRAHYTDAGVLPRSSLLQEAVYSQHSFSIHLMSGSTTFQACLFIFAYVAALSLLVGYRTRLATIVSWILLLSLQNRNPLLLQGDDHLRRLLLFWSIFLPLGNYYSLDAWLARFRTSTSRSSSPRTVATLATSAFILQIALIYWVSGLAKTDAIWRSEGSGIYYALSLDHLVTPIGQWLLNYPDFLSFISRGVVPLELCGPVLLFVAVQQERLRLVVASAFILFHVALGLTLSLALFSPTCIVGWIALLPTLFWTRLKKMELAAKFGRWLHGSTQRVLLPLYRRAPEMAALLRWEDKTPQKSWLSKMTTLIVGGSLALMLMWNYIMVFPQKINLIPPRVLQMATFLRLDQKWTMFAPFPSKNDGWYVIVGETVAGSEVNVLQSGKDITWEKPEHLYQFYDNYRWRQLHMHLAMSKNARLRAVYAQYLQREWNKGREDSQHLNSLRMYYVLEETLPNFREAAIAPVLLYATTFIKPDQTIPVGIDWNAPDLVAATGFWPDRRSDYTLPPDGVPRIRPELEKSIKVSE